MPAGTDAVAWPSAWRVVAAALRALSRGTLLVVAALFVFSDQPPHNTFVQLRLFAGLVAAPELAAWCLERAFSARLRIVDGTLELEQRESVLRVPAKAVVAVDPWALPLPGPGVWLRLRSGRLLPRALQVRDASALAETLVAAGATPALLDGLARPSARYEAARLACPPWRMDHPVVKFVLFPLLPATVAFRLHQILAYGGPFGEYHLFGLGAWLLGFALWWASWAFGLLLLAAGLAFFVETVSALAAVAGPLAAMRTRRVTEHVRRVLYFGGIPAFLILRFWDW